MKVLAQYDAAIGADGHAQAVLGVEASDLKLQVSATYPIAKIVEPAVQQVEKLLTKLEQAIPGDWDKPLIERLKVEFREALIAQLSE